MHSLIKSNFGIIELCLIIVSIYIQVLLFFVIYMYEIDIAFTIFMLLSNLGLR